MGSKVARKTIHVWLVCVVLPYALLSVAIYALWFIPSGTKIVAALLWFWWLAGPAANLAVALRDSWDVYCVGTGLVLLGSLATIHVFRRSSAAGAFLVVILATIWTAFGLLSYLACF